MKIGIDICQVVYKGTGVARYTERLIEGLLKYDTKNQYVFFFSSLRQKLDKKLEDAIKKKFILKKYIFPQTLLNLFWNKLHIFPINYFVGNVDLFLTSDWTEPPSYSKKITVVHDLVFLKFPETLDKKIVNVQKRRLNWVKKESHLIITDSFATKNDIIKLLKIPEKRIEVIYPAVEIIYPSAEEIKKTLKKYQIKTPFILTVGKIEPRKNLQRLINAFIKIDIKNINLIVVGPKGWGIDNYQLPIINRQNIKFLGFIPDKDLYSLYAATIFFIYPSIYEGFGYPIVEAMKLGCPVITSNTSSLQEIAKNYGLLINPYSEDEISKAILTLYKNNHLRNQLKEKSKKRGKDFSLEKFAHKIIKVFEKFA